MSVFTIAHSQAAFFRFNHIGQSPFTGKLFNSRFDCKVNEKHSAFLRYSQDNNNNFSSTGNMESNWQFAKNFATNVVLGVTSVITPRIVNDFRYNWGILHFTLRPPIRRMPRSDRMFGCRGIAHHRQ